MRLGIMQPYFMPYIGYYQLIKAVDLYVVFDDVNYIKRGWSARNNILINGQKHLFHVDVQNGSQNSLYCDVVVIDDFVKLRKTIEMNYKRAPYFVQTMSILDEIFSYSDRRFNYFIMHSLQQVLSFLDVDTKLVLSSTIQKDKQLKGKDKILDICRILNADVYINAIGGQELYDEKDFKNKGIELKFLRPQLMPYPQFSKEFVPLLSMVDVMMFNSVRDIVKMLDNYELF